MLTGLTPPITRHSFAGLRHSLAYSQHSLHTLLSPNHALLASLTPRILLTQLTLLSSRSLSAFTPPSSFSLSPLSLVSTLSTFLFLTHLTRLFLARSASSSSSPHQLLLNMYCTGPKFCVANDGLPPTRSPRLRRVKAFMSGAGYCLHRNSAALILASLPCQESSSSCTTAIDSYMSTLAMYGRLRAYRATTLPVAIPQDQDKKNLDNMRHPDCFSRFDSDIALWWAPPDPRRSNVCIVNRAATLGAAVRVGGQQGASPGSGPGSVVSVGAAASVHFWATEDEALEVFHDSPGGVGTHGKHDKRGERGKRDRQHPAVALLRHRVRNEKSTLVIFDRFALLTTDDVWRGASVVFFNFYQSPMLTVTWLPAGTELRVGPGETKEVFVPHLRQAIRAGHGSSGNEGSRRVQLDGSCDAAASMRVLAEGGRGAAPSSCIGFEVLQGRDLKTDDLGSVDARSADACCNACTRRKGSCAGWTFKVRS